MKLYEEEREKGGMLDADTSVATHITAHAPGYIDKDLETIVGLQTDKPLKRAMFPSWWLAHSKIRYRRIRIQNGSANRGLLQETSQNSQ